MTSQSQPPASTVESTRDRRSFVRLLMGLSLAAPALALSACATGKPPVEQPNYYGGNGRDRDRGGGGDSGGSSR